MNGMAGLDGRDSVQFKLIYITRLTMDIVTKQLYIIEIVEMVNGKIDGRERWMDDWMTGLDGRDRWMKVDILVYNM